MVHDPTPSIVDDRPNTAPARGIDARGWRLCVAPMMEWTDRSCRHFHRLLSPHARLYTEMLVAAALVHGDRHRLLRHGGEHPLALQLGGSDPALLAAAAHYGVKAGYDEINLNVCCPSDRVQSGNFGACLMRDPERVGQCVRAMRGAVDVPVTAKCRIGVDDQDAWADLQRFADIVHAAGVSVLEVHARKAWLDGLSPKENRNIPPLDYDRVYRLKQEHPGLIVVINGGITDVAQAVAHLSHVDGVMLGRAAYRDPWILAELEHALWGTPLPTRASIVRRMRPYVEAELAAGGTLRHVARHMLGLYHGQPRARLFRRLLGEGMRAPCAGYGLLEQVLEAVEPVLRAA